MLTLCRHHSASNSSDTRRTTRRRSQRCVQSWPRSAREALGSPTLSSLPRQILVYPLSFPTPFDFPRILNENVARGPE